MQWPSFALDDQGALYAMTHMDIAVLQQERIADLEHMIIALVVSNGGQLSVDDGSLASVNLFQMEIWRDERNASVTLCAKRKEAQ
jgi:hypothetical protein